MIAPSQQKKSVQNKQKQAVSGKQKLNHRQAEAMEKIREAVSAKKVTPVKDTLVNKITKYLKGVWAELKRVSWPTKQEIKKGTIVVIITVLLISFYLFIVDQGFALLFSLIRKLLGR